MNRQPLTASFFVILLLTAPAFLQAQSVNLDVPYYVQGKDSSWADEKLGNKSSLTIRTHGCALTCISMVMSHFSGKELTPSDMNKWLKRHNGFLDALDGERYLGEVSLNWPALADFNDGMVYTRFDWKVQPADLKLITYYLDEEIPVIAEVTYKNAPHYIVITGYNQQGFMINDPEFPDEHELNKLYNISDKWGSGPSRNINGIRVLYPASQ